MRPLNGKCAMTREERNARRRELMKNPFYAELIRKRNRKNWAKNREKRKAQMQARLAAMTPEEYAAFVARRREKAHERLVRDRERINARQRAYHAAHAEALRAGAKRRRERDLATGKEQARIRRNIELRRIKLATDPEFRAAHNARRRAWSKSPGGLAARRRQLEARWAEVVEQGRQAVKVYVAHVRTEETRRAFVQWYSRRLIDRTTGLGHIVQPADELVERS